MMDSVSMWNIIREGLQKIFSEKKITDEEESKLQSLVNEHCKPEPVPGHPGALQANGGYLYKRIKQFLKEQVRQIFVEGLSVQNGIAEFYDTKWEHYFDACLDLDYVCEALNENYVTYTRRAGNKKALPVIDVGEEMWRHYFFKQIEETETEELLEIYHRDRNGEQIESKYVYPIMNCYFALDAYLAPHRRYYADHFETQFLAQTATYYKGEGELLLRKKSVTQYMMRVEEILEEEEKRVQRFLRHKPTGIEVRRACGEALVESHLDLLSAEFQKLLEEEKYEELGNMTSVISLIPEGTEKLVLKLEGKYCSLGLETIQKYGVTSMNDPEQYVTSLLEARKKCVALVSVGEKQQLGFAEALDKACSKFMNSNFVTKRAKSRKTPELLAKCLDNLLKNPLDAEHEEKFNEVMIVFRYLHDMDVFKASYTKMVAKRLLSQKPIIEEAEALATSKLKTACGWEYSRVLETMLADIRESTDLSGNFRDSLELSSVPLGINFNVQVLSSGSWPLRQTVTCNLPIELGMCVQNFSTFYKKLHPKRKLTYQHSLCTGELETNCFNKRYTFQASAFQMAVLLKFNDVLSWTVGELEEETKIEKEFLLQVIRSLLKARLLRNENEGEEDTLKPTTRISLYTGYTNNNEIVNINVPLRAPKNEHQRDTQALNETRRKPLIQAAIVRILKRAKTMEESKLIEEVADQLSSTFKASPFIIKKCIEVLIEKEYVERDQEQGLLRYLP